MPAPQQFLSKLIALFGQPVAKMPHEYHAREGVRAPWVGLALHYDGGACREPEGRCYRPPRNGVHGRELYHPA